MVIRRCVLLLSLVVLPSLSAVSALWAQSAQASRGKEAFDAGMRLMRENRPDKAETQFERAVAADERSAFYHHWLANAVGQQAQNANPIRQGLIARRIRAEWERAVELDPNFLDARDGLITFYLQAPGFMSGSPEKARAQQREIAAAPDARAGAARTHDQARVGHRELAPFTRRGALPARDDPREAGDAVGRRLLRD